MTDDYRNALAYFTRALAAADAIGSRVERAVTLTSMALPKAAVGDVQDALHWLDETLAIHQQTGDVFWQAAAIQNQGLITRKYVGDPQRAITVLEAALAIRRRIGARDAERNTLSAIASAYEDLRQFAEAERVLREIVEIDAALEKPELEADRARLDRVHSLQSGGLN